MRFHHVLKDLLRASIHKFDTVLSLQGKCVFQDIFQYVDVLGVTLQFRSRFIRDVGNYHCFRGSQCSPFLLSDVVNPTRFKKPLDFHFHGKSPQRM